jgi:hypothetical protein
MRSPPDARFLRGLRARLPVSPHTHRAALTDLAVARREVHVLERTVSSEGKLQGISDRHFKAARDVVKENRRTKLDRNRLWVIWEAVRNTLHLDGAVAEVGAYRGGSARFIAAAYLELGGQAVTMEVVDTFEGAPSSALTEHDSRRHADAWEFEDTSYEEVVEYLAPFEHITVHKGEFSVVAPTLPDRRYRLVHLDVDLYEPTLEGLHYFGSRLVPGGIAVLDDYDKPSCPGIRTAAEEFLAGSTDFQSWTPRTKQFVLVKR